MYLLYLKFSALIRDDKHFARVQGSAINKPIIHIFSSAGRELATVKVCVFFKVYCYLLFNLGTQTKRSVDQAEQVTCCLMLTNFVNIVLG